MTGIYAIRNKINGKIYIDQSIDIERRLVSHRKLLLTKKHRNKHLETAYHKYGEDHFEFIILEHCSAEQLSERERYYISQYGSTNPEKGYNKTSGGETNFNMSSETRQKISQTMKSIVRTEEHCENISKSKMGNKNPAYGTHINQGAYRSPEQRKKISRSLRKLSDDQVIDIYHRSNSGERTCDLMKEFGVSRKVITRIKGMQREYAVLIPSLLGSEKLWHLIT